MPDLHDHTPQLAVDCSCAECGSALASDQNYCLSCGHRQGSARLSLLELLLAPRPDAGGAADQEPGQPRRADPQMPTPRLAASLLMIVLGFGVFVGTVAGPRTADSGAATRRSLALLLAPGTPAPRPAAAGVHPGPLPPPIPVPTPSPTASAATPSSISRPAPAGKAPRAPVKTPARSPAVGPAPPAPVRHVFEILLSGHGYEDTYGPSSRAPYLARSLAPRGNLLSNYRTFTRGELANAIALISGQGPNPETQANCPVFDELTPGTAGPDDQATGRGCLYPAQIYTVADQLAANHLEWRLYAEAMADGPPGTKGSCRHPNPGSPDPPTASPPGTGYATWRNPFVYFHTILDSPACASSDLDLSRLPADLKLGHRAPALSYIVPSLCHDGRDTPCAAGRPAGLASADAFLRAWVPKILSSPAYRDGGLLVVATDQGPPPPGTSSVGPGPNGAAGGGAVVGSLVISRFVRAGSHSRHPYDHLSLLRTVEDIFGLRPLGLAGRPGVVSFGREVFNAVQGHRRLHHSDTGS